MTYTKHGVRSSTNILSWSPVLSFMSSLIGTCFVTFPSATSASKTQTKLTLFSSDVCALAVLGTPGTIRLKTTAVQTYTAHRPGYIVSSPTKRHPAYHRWYLATEVYTTFEARIRG